MGRKTILLLTIQSNIFQETKALLDLGNALQTMLKGYAFGYIKAEIIKRTILGALWSALWPLGLLKIARVVDNPFSVAKNRAEKAGAVLAGNFIQVLCLYHIMSCFSY